MYSLEVGQLVIVGIDAYAKEQSRVSPVDDLVVAELDEIALVLLVAWGYEAVDLALQFDFFFVLPGGGKGGV